MCCAETRLKLGFVKELAPERLVKTWRKECFTTSEVSGEPLLLALPLRCLSSSFTHNGGIKRCQFDRYDIDTFQTFFLLTFRARYRSKYRLPEDQTSQNGWSQRTATGSFISRLVCPGFQVFVSKSCYFHECKVAKWGKMIFPLTPGERRTFIRKSTKTTHAH